MDPFASQNTSKKQKNSQQNSSFANALAEIERPLGNSPVAANQANHNSLLSQAMARTGGNLAGQHFEQSSSNAITQNESMQSNDPSQLLAQQEEQKRRMEEEKKRQQKEALRKKLHDQINPVDTHDVFSAKEKKVAEELEATRKEIKQLASEIQKLHRDLDIAASQTIVTPGDDGAYYVSFFQKLRSFIMLLRQKVKSARSWAQQANAKKAKKKKQSKKPGLEIGGAKQEQSKAVFDMMNHERSNAYGGS